MAQVPENDRLSGPFLATAGQVDFPADFPLMKAAALRVRREREGVSTILSAPEVVPVAVSDNGFTARLITPSLAGDRMWIYSELPPARLRSHTPNGTVRTPTLEGDATEAQAQLQEVRRDIQRGFLAPIGETGFEFPAAPDRSGRMLAFDAAGGVVLIDAVEVLATVGVFVDDGAWGSSSDPLTHDDGPFA